MRWLLTVSLLLIGTQASLADVPQASWFPKAPALPAPSGEVVNVANVAQLYQAAKTVAPGGTILMADGHYKMPRFFEITTDRITLRSASGDRNKVIIDGIGAEHGELIAIRDCKGVTIADVTVQNIKWNGIKINSDLSADEVVVHNCVIHNIWQRGVKAPAVPQDKQELSPRDCVVRYCLFYNDRAKRFADDETDTPKTFDGNYIGGIDAKNTVDWKIHHNVFIGIQGRTREGRGCIYISENGRGCKIENNIFVDSDIAIALGNPTLGYSPLQAIDCVAKNNVVADCPETGILACFTRNCTIANNTIYDPPGRLRRLIWVQKSNDGLQVKNNLLIGPPIQNISKSKIVDEGNVVQKNLVVAEAGQNQLSADEVKQVTQVTNQRKQAAAQVAKQLPAVGQLSAVKLSPEVIAAMKKVHARHKGEEGYVAQFGDSITHSMAFWSPISWDAPDKYLTIDDGLPRKPGNKRWRDYVRGARDKGPKFANYSGWRVGQVHEAMNDVLQNQQPEMAIVMVGTNDISGGRVPQGYRAGLEQVIQKCLAAGCVPLLNTIPPRRDRDEAVRAANEVIRDVAAKAQVPLVDFNNACLQIRPGKSWEGTVMAKDGIHPSGGKTNVYTAENMANCGYALRNWINFVMLRQVYFHVLHPDQK